MGIAAYNRGSKCISGQIERDYMDHGGRSKLNKELLQKAEEKIVQLEEFCRDAQALFWNSTDPETATGLVKSNIHYFWKKKKDTKKYRRMMDECIAAHNEWVYSDFRYSLQHVQVCYRKAKAWKAMLGYLNKAYKLPFKVPAHL